MRLMQDTRGQLLLLAGILLTIALILLAMSTISFINMGQRGVFEQASRLHYRFSDVREKFGVAFNYSANNISAVNGSFNATEYNFTVLLAYYGLNFNVSWYNNTKGAVLNATRANLILIDSNRYVAKLTLTLSDERTTIKESVIYTLWM